MNTGKIIVLVIGFGITCLGAFGTFNAITRWGEKPVDKHDVETNGKITSLVATELRHAVAGTLSTQYDVKYTFTAEDGKSYNGTSHNIAESTFSSLSEGDEIVVKYHSNQPSINGAPAIGTYVSVEEMERVKLPASPLFKLLFSMSTLAVGVAVLVYALKAMGPTPTHTHDSASL